MLSWTAMSSTEHWSTQDTTERACLCVNETTRNDADGHWSVLRRNFQGCSSSLLPAARRIFSIRRLGFPHLLRSNVTQDGSVVVQSLREDAVCALVLGYAFQLFYNYRRSIQLTALLWLVFCRCFEKKCTLHCNVIYLQTIYILSSNFMSVIFMSVNFMSVIFSQPMYTLTGHTRCRDKSAARRMLRGAFVTRHTNVDASVTCKL